MGLRYTAGLRDVVTRSRSTLLAGILILCCTGVASAENPYRLEVFGSMGVAGYLDFNIFGFGPSRGASLNYGGGFGVRPFSVNRSRLLRMLGAEFEANGTRSTNNGVATTQGYFTGNIVFHAPAGGAEPYFLIGGGVSHAGGDTHRAGDAGAGVKFFVTTRVSLRPEFRVFFTEYIGNFARGSVAVGFHW